MILQIYSSDPGTTLKSLLWPLVLAWEQISQPCHFQHQTALPTMFPRVHLWSYHRIRSLPPCSLCLSATSHFHFKLGIIYCFYPVCPELTSFFPFPFPHLSSYSIVSHSLDWHSCLLPFACRLSRSISSRGAQVDSLLPLA